MINSLGLTKEDMEKIIDQPSKETIDYINAHIHWIHKNHCKLCGKRLQKIEVQETKYVIDQYAGHKTA